MSEVFGLIDGHPEEVGSACCLTNEGSEMDSATISYVDSLLREDCGGRKSPHGAEWEEDEEELNQFTATGLRRDKGRHTKVTTESEKQSSVLDAKMRQWSPGEKER